MLNINKQISLAAAVTTLVAALCLSYGMAIAAENLVLDSMAQKAFSVKVSRGRLSINADETPFGSIIDKVAKEAGFEVTISPDIAAKTLSTSFRDLDLERGIQRLMGLISHRNFFIYYGRDGHIKKLEIYGKTGTLDTSSKTKKSPAPQMRTPMIMEPIINAAPSTPSSTDTPKRPLNLKKINGVPYIPPASAPEYIPPHRGINKKRK